MACALPGPPSSQCGPGEELSSYPLFALFYMLQCLVAVLVAWQSRDLPRWTLRVVGFSLVAMICLAVFALGLPSE